MSTTVTGYPLLLISRDRLTKESDSYEKVGEFFDLWKARFDDSKSHKIPVAIKVMRGAPAHNGELHKRVAEKLNLHAEAWIRLKHPNVLPFYGISNDFGYLPALIVEYCENGNVVEFLKDKEPKPDFVLHLIRGIAHGLKYLHSKDIVHGDLRGSNVMISNNGVPYLTDFGIVFIIDHNEFTTSKIAGPARWTAPESLDPPEAEDACPYTKESDTYAFAMTAVEVSTGKAPFADKRNDSSVIFFVIDGGRPTMPDILETREPICSMIKQSWDGNPRKRPTAAEICKTMDGELNASNYGLLSETLRALEWVAMLPSRWWFGT